MFQQHFVRAAVRVAIAGVMGMSLTLIEPQTSFAFCGGKCQNGKRCAELVKEKKKELNGIHLVIGLQKCLEQTQLENVIGKDSECVFSSYGFSSD